jgi:hypothetical protein
MLDEVNTNEKTSTVLMEDSGGIFGFNSSKSFCGDVRIEDELISSWNSDNFL